MGLGIIRLEADGGTEFGDRLVQLALITERVAQLEASRRVSWFEPDSGSVLGDRLVQVALTAEGEPSLRGRGTIRLESRASRNSAIPSPSFP